MVPNDERQFLHDLATPIGTALFLSDSLRDNLESNNSVDAESLQQIKLIYESLNKVSGLLHARRDALIKRGAST